MKSCSALCFDCRRRLTRSTLKSSSKRQKLTTPPRKAAERRNLISDLTAAYASHVHVVSAKCSQHTLLDPDMAHADRPRRPITAVIPVRIPVELVSRIDALSDALDEPRAATIRRVLGWLPPTKGRPE